MIEPIESLGEAFNKTARLAREVFILGDVPNRNQIKEVLSAKSSSKRFLIKAGLALIYNNLPEDLRSRLHEKLFEKLPLHIKGEGEYRILEKIGSGSTNSVYLLSNRDKKSYALAQSKLSFRDTSSALRFSERQKLEYEYFKRIFKDIPGLIQRESYAIYERDDGASSVMFIREFVPGPLKDIFDIPKDELNKLLTNNQLLSNQLTKFVEISIKNKNVIVGEQLDILGNNNLAIAGEKGNERLILLDPHTRVNKISFAEKKINDRLEYLKDIVSISNKARYHHHIDV